MNSLRASSEYFLDDDKLRKKIGSNAKELAKDFTWEKQGEKLAKMYEILFSSAELAVRFWV